MCARQTAVALLQTEHIVVGAGLLKEFDLLADKLKACQHLDKPYLIILRDRPRHIGGHNGCHKSRILGHFPCRCPLTQDVFRNEHTGHVARERHIFAGLGIQRVDAQSVGIGIGRQHDIGVLLFRQLQREGECLGIFRVGVIQGRKVGVGHLLLGHHVYVLEAKLGENPSHRHIARAVEGRVDDLHVLRHLRDHFGMDDLLFQLRHVLVVDLLADDHIETSLLRLFLVHGLYRVVIRYVIDLCDNLLILGRRHLRAVLPIALVTVVLRRIVARRDHDTRDTAKLSEREG